MANLVTSVNRSLTITCLMLWRTFPAIALLTVFFVDAALAQSSQLTVARIMQDPETWIGAWPSQTMWSEDGETIYFYWNPKGEFVDDSLFSVERDGSDLRQVPPGERRAPVPIFDGWHHGEHVYDSAFRKKVYQHDGNLYIYDRAEQSRRRLTETGDRERNPRFTPDGDAVIYQRGNNLYRLNLVMGSVTQLTDFREGEDPEQDDDPDDQDAFLEKQQTDLFDYIRQQREESEAREAAEESDRAATSPPPTYYVGSKNIEQLQMDPTGRFVTFALTESTDEAKQTKAIDYVTESGYAEERMARPKVGVPAGSYDLYVQDLARDTTIRIDLHTLSGAFDVPAYRREPGVAIDSSESKRVLSARGPYWSGDGRFAVLDVRSRDNKDRWIVRLDPETTGISVLDRQHDDAWIAGPGISWWGGASTVGWLPNDRQFYFLSEKTGYSHLYVVDVETGSVSQLTTGDFEVSAVRLSRDGKVWYFASSEESPHVRHFYRMPVAGGPRIRLTTLDGHNDVALGPDDTRMAVRRSFTTSPPEIYVQDARNEALRVTHSPTDEWLEYPWREGAIIRFEASDGVMVPAQVFEPAASNGAAVLFVHGAGYLQNVHRGWSGYFREYMFHNLLTDLGYVVMNVDYRASAGYGRDWRTAIYRHMGGRDLADYVDASQYLTETYDIDPERIAIYGGSYGGFITLMALFTAPEYFGGGAALRSVTDWAHYNHVYTANILNTPSTDSLAYARSSPINFIEGLEDPLLMAHGILDLNVQFQDIVRLAQRLIELGKEDWELAVYPVEPHGFTEPSSWTDEYRRILELIEESVGPRRMLNESAPLPEGQ